jgi:hypothetical protein
MNNRRIVRQRFRRLSSWIPTAWVIFLVVVSLQPLRPTSTKSGTPAHLFVHVLVFGFTAFLLQLRPKAAFLCPLVLAAAIELTQHFIYRHKFEWHDLLADVLGIALAILPQAYSRQCHRSTGS